MVRTSMLSAGGVEKIRSRVLIVTLGGPRCPERAQGGGQGPRFNVQQVFNCSTLTPPLGRCSTCLTPSCYSCSTPAQDMCVPRARGSADARAVCAVRSRSDLSCSGAGWLCACVQHFFKCRRMHCKHERAANVSLAGQSLITTAKRSEDALRTSCCLCWLALAVMMAGCVLVCSTFKCRRMHCQHERAANVSLGSHSSQRQ